MNNREHRSPSRSHWRNSSSFANAKNYGDRGRPHTSTYPSGGDSNHSSGSAGRSGPTRRRRMTSPERFEIQQMISAGILPKSALMDEQDDEQVVVDRFDEEGDGVERNFEVEIIKDEPKFIKRELQKVNSRPLFGTSSMSTGFTSTEMLSAATLEPVAVVKNPEGSLSRCAQAVSELAKDRRQLRQQYVRGEASVVSTDANGDPDIVHLPPSISSKADQNQERRYDNEFITPTSIKEQRESLPVFQYRDELLKMVQDNDILIVVGDTGSGKTTQLTQYLLESRFARPVNTKRLLSRSHVINNRLIGCTQPRRVAATSVAKRVAQEVGSKLGDTVGYTIRFEDCTHPQRTKIKYMTDGMLLRECLLDPCVLNYSVVLLDEAHERTLHTDVLFGLLKDTVVKRKEFAREYAKRYNVHEDSFENPYYFRLVITSATLDSSKFSVFFNNAPIFYIPGRTFPVNIQYSLTPQLDPLESALLTVLEIHLSEPEGDILVFLTGQEEIDTSCEILAERLAALGMATGEIPPLIILPVYAALPSDLQSRIFEKTPAGSRKVVLATNIAETSITIDGIYYVIDPGFVKQKVYNPKLGMDSLIITPISQAQAKQRSGRAGRTGPGTCFRLYTEQAYEEEMLTSSIPEIQRTNLAMTVLTLKAMGVKDLLNFDWMDPPPQLTLISALHFLYTIGALAGDDGELTQVGARMAEFPLDPPLAKFLIESIDLKCSEEALTIVAMLSVPTPFYRPKERQREADQKKSQFHMAEGDHLTLLNVYECWMRNDRSISWCFENFIQARTMRRAYDIRTQLLNLMRRFKLPLLSCGHDYSRICRAITAGFFMHISKKDPNEQGYKTLIDNQTVFIHPSSTLFQKEVQWILYHELVFTSKEYMRDVIVIDPRWLMQAAPTFFKLATGMTKNMKDMKIQPLANKFEKPDEWRLSKRSKPPGRASQAFG